MYRSSPFRSTLNTGINMFPFQVCTEASDAFKNAKKRGPRAKTARGKKGTKARKGCVSGSANVPVCGYMYTYIYMYILYIYVCIYIYMSIYVYIYIISIMFKHTVPPVPPSNQQWIVQFDTRLLLKKMNTLSCDFSWMRDSTAMSMTPPTDLHQHIFLGW